MGTVSGSGLSSYFQSIISNTMMYEKQQKLDNLETRKSTLESQKKMYTELQSRFSELQKLTQALISKDGSYAIKAGKDSAIDGYGTNDPVVSASLTSSSVAGEYEFGVNRLATSHQVRGTKQASSSTALGLSGEFFIGGRTALQGPLATEVTRDADVISAFTTVADTSITGAIDAGKKQLGDGNYKIETRKNSDGTWQFRMIDSDSGQAISVRSGTDTTTHTSDWQNITAGEFDTGRGLKINFGDPSTYTDADQGVAGEITYAAQGSKVTISSSDSLANIASKINSVSYADGNKVVANIIDGRLVLTAKSTGRAMQASETDGNEVLRSLGILDSAGSGTYSTFVAANETVAQTAQFSVNGIQMTRRSNSNLTNVVSGMTLTLTGTHDDWLTQSDKLAVTENMDSAGAAIESFTSKMNDMLIFLEENTGVTKIADGQYTRGGLADDSIFSDLRSRMFSVLSSEMGVTYQRNTTPNGAAGDLITLGDYNSLRDIGITLDENLNISVTDESLLNDALVNHQDDVTKLFDAVMGAVDDELGRYTGSWGDYGSSTTGYLSTASTGINNQLTDVTSDITDENERLDSRQASLVQQYAEMQSQLLQLQYMQQTWSAIYGGASTSY